MAISQQGACKRLGARPNTIIAGTLGECIRKFLSQPVSRQHLYEIHTAPQSDLAAWFCRRTTSLSWRGSEIFLGT
jgi:hypothetical protein